MTKFQLNSKMPNPLNIEMKIGRFAQGKPLLALALVGAALIVAGKVVASPFEDNRWMRISSGKLFDVYAENQLYRSPSSTSFFVHLKIHNKTKKIVGITSNNRGANELGSFKTFRWGIVDKHFTSDVYDGMMPSGPPSLMPGDKELLLKAFQSESNFCRIEAGEDADLYADFNASTWKDVERQNADWQRSNNINSNLTSLANAGALRAPALLMEMDGGCFATDGEIVETNDPVRALKVDMPPMWKNVPENARVQASEWHLTKRKINQYFGACRSFANSIGEMSILIEHDPKNAVAFNNRAFAYVAAGAYDLAIADADKAIQLDSKMASAHTAKALAHRGQKKLEAALKDCENALRIVPREDHALDIRSSLKLAKGDYAGALADADQAGLDLYSPNRAKALFGLKRYAEAKPACQKILKANCDFYEKEEAYNLLARMALAEGKLQECQNYLSESMNLGLSPFGGNSEPLGKLPELMRQDFPGKLKKLWDGGDPTMQHLQRIPALDLILLAETYEISARYKELRQNQKAAANERKLAEHLRIFAIQNEPERLKEIARL